MLLVLSKTIQSPGDSKSPFAKGGFRGNVNTLNMSCYANFRYFKFAFKSTAIRYAARAKQDICKGSKSWTVA